MGITDTLMQGLVANVITRLELDELVNDFVFVWPWTLAHLRTKLIPEGYCLATRSVDHCNDDALMYARRANNERLRVFGDVTAVHGKVNEQWFCAKAWVFLVMDDRYNMGGGWHASLDGVCAAQSSSSLISGGC